MLMTTWNGGDRRAHKFAHVGSAGCFYRQSTKRSLLHRMLEQSAWLHCCLNRGQELTEFPHPPMARDLGTKTVPGFANLPRQRLKSQPISGQVLSRLKSSLIGTPVGL